MSHFFPLYLIYPNIDMAIKRPMIKCIFQPVLCYQCQTWSISRRQANTITTCEMRCLRKTMRCLRKTVGTTPCNQHIEQQQMKCFGHLMRIEPSQLPSRAYNNRQSGHRAQGRPRVRWIDNITDTLRRHGMTTTSATHMAQETKSHHNAVKGNREQDKTSSHYVETSSRERTCISLVAQSRARTADKLLNGSQQQFRNTQ
jgi:hypothetical protein